MGLDMYAYSASKDGAYDEYYESVDAQGQNSTCSKPKELAYWRKHPNLHGRFKQLWESKGKPGIKDPDNDNVQFNGIELELTWDDLTQLEEDINAGSLPDTSGFFFGDPSDDYYREADLEFIKEARTDIFIGLRVFYNSSW